MKRKKKELKRSKNVKTDIKTNVKESVNGSE